MIKKHTRTHALTMATQTMESEPEVSKLLEEEPTRVEEYKSSGTSDVWQTFRMISVDGQPAGFARCQQCGLVLAHNPSCGTTSLKKHVATHVVNNSIPQTVEMPVVASPIPPVKK